MGPDSVLHLFRNGNSAAKLTSFHIPFLPHRRSCVKYRLAFVSFFVFLAASSASGESFRNPVRIPTDADPDRILVADLNGDKRLDIVWTATGTTISEPSAVNTLLAQADGSFAAGPVLTLPTGVLPSCQLEDQNGDGKPDPICPYRYWAQASVDRCTGGLGIEFRKQAIKTVDAFQQTEYNISSCDIASRCSVPHSRGAAAKLPPVR